MNDPTTFGNISYAIDRYLAPKKTGRLQREIWQWELNLEAARSYECRAEIMEAYAMITRLRQCQRTIRKIADRQLGYEDAQS